MILVSAAAGWRDELNRRLQAWGAHVQVIADVAQLAHDDCDVEAALVVFERGPTPGLQRWCKGRCLVRVSADGPLRAQRRGGAWRVSCYSGESLLQALQAPTRTGQGTLAVLQGLH